MAFHLIHRHRSPAALVRSYKESIPTQIIYSLRLLVETNSYICNEN